MSKKTYDKIDNLSKLIKKHGSILIINLQNLQQNYLNTVKYVSPTKVAAVLKSNAYGFGLTQVGKALMKVGCTEYFVATIDEALELKECSKGAKINIYTLHGTLEDNDNMFINNDIIPVINSLSQLLHWLDLAKKNNCTLNAVIHVDTGINRLGLQSTEIEYLKQNIDDITRNLNIFYIMSHLACSDQYQSLANEDQYQNFCNIVSSFPNIKKSLAATCGAYLGKKFLFDLIRVGSILYGANPTPHIIPNPSLPVLSCYSSVIKVNSIKKGEKIGYGHIWQADRDSIIATVSFGFSDGFVREATNAHLYINDFKVKVVGRISMDCCMVDITDIVNKVPIEEGTVVEIIGKNQDVDTLANDMNTLNTVTFNAFNNRYPRIYLEKN